MGDLFEDYAAGRAWDEMFDPQGGIRPGYVALHSALAALGVDDLAERGALRDRSLRDQGITFLSREAQVFGEGIRCIVTTDPDGIFIQLIEGL